MSEQDIHDRFEELEAGRILGDLSMEEQQEWKQLSRTLGAGNDISLEMTAAAIEAEFVASEPEALPSELADTIRRRMPQFTVDGDQPPQPVELPVWKRIYQSPQAAWGLAALLALLLVASFIANKPGIGPGTSVEKVPVSPMEARDLLVTGADDLIESDFGGTESFSGMSGKVVWSDRLQEGYMTLTNLPANDPSINQYQLWMVDPSRDEKPVDGGVFDIPSGQSTAVIPIRNSLIVKKPQAFVITLEQPGGVVVSKQETVVALAKAS